MVSFKYWLIRRKVRKFSKLLVEMKQQSEFIGDHCLYDEFIDHVEKVACSRFKGDTAQGLEAYKSVLDFWKSLTSFLKERLEDLREENYS